MNSRFLLAAELRSGVRAPLQDAPRTIVAFQRGTTCAIAAAVAAEAQDQGVLERIAGRAERQPPHRKLPNSALARPRTSGADSHGQKFSDQYCGVAAARGQPSAAQTMVLPGALRLAGYRATCGPVDTMTQPIDDIAAAYKGRIILHPRVLDLPRAQQLFWYTHECAHQIFGPGEAAADCWAVQQGNIQSWLTRDELSRSSGTMRRYPADETRSYGVARVVAMDACFVDDRVMLPKGDGD